MTEKALIKIEEINAVEIFVEGKYNETLDFIKTEATIENPDASTGAGRKLIRSAAAKIASSKVLIEKIGKSLADDERKKIEDRITAINDSRNFIKDCLEYYKEEVSKPLTDYEEKEKEALAALELKKEIAEAHVIALGENAFIDEKKAVEAERLRQEKEQVQREADDKARENIKLEQQEAEQKAARKQLFAENEAERLKIKNKEDARQAEIDKEAAIQVTKQRALDEEKQREHARILKEKGEQEKKERKAADVDHRKKLNNEALDDFKNNGVDSEIAKGIILLIAKGLISNITINY